MKHTFDGLVAAITGAGSGIGRQLALQLAAQGCHLALADRSQEGLDSTLAMLESVDAAVKVTHYLVDVSERDQVERFAQSAEADHGAVNFVFNNAGVALGARIEDVSYEDMHWLMNINFWGVVHGCTAFLPILKKQPSAHIVNVSSVFGLFTAPFNGVYSASKFAVNGFTDALAQELAGTHVGVSCVFPAGIKTDIAKKARMTVDPTGKESAEDLQKGFEKMFWTTAEQAAEQVIRGVELNKQRILVGKGASVMDLLRRLLPVAYARCIQLLS